MFIATAALAAAHGVLVVTGSVELVDPEAGLNSFPIITVGCVLGALIGALVATRQPRNPIGWLFLGGQLGTGVGLRSEEHTSELQSRQYLVCRLLLEKKKKKTHQRITNKNISPAVTN